MPVAPGTLAITEIVREATQARVPNVVVTSATDAAKLATEAAPDSKEELALPVVATPKKVPDSKATSGAPSATGAILAHSKVSKLPLGEAATNKESKKRGKSDMRVDSWSGEEDLDDIIDPMVGSQHTPFLG